MDRSIALRGLGTLLLGAAVAGCATVAPVPYSDMASSAYMAPDKSDASGRVPYRYSTPVDWRAYNKVILEPVVVYRGRDHQFGDMSDKDKATLAAYMQTRFAERLRSRFTLVRARTRHAADQTDAHRRRHQYAGARHALTVRYGWRSLQWRPGSA